LSPFLPAIFIRAGPATGTVDILVIFDDYINKKRLGVFPQASPVRMTRGRRELRRW
jgi:hypothetical protein